MEDTKVLKVVYWEYRSEKTKKEFGPGVKLGEAELTGPLRNTESKLFKKEPHTLFQSDDNESLIVSTQDIINVEYK